MLRRSNEKDFSPLEAMSDEVIVAALAGMFGVFVGLIGLTALLYKKYPNLVSKKGTIKYFGT